ncbi:uncharacterized protein H6S33_005114 [Morchella sextelata]|uniref:uncharacterized protein n=1 Tax=Morchella sextelata TaxID=1174677 RepID=UPI001D03ECFC|nr:uncharacterized protein H6S33_005114 [Morchella sextelata]KAH0605132.1 hypothetical protein H6S33_005114 [Morchella sextelata]
MSSLPTTGGFLPLQQPDALLPQRNRTLPALMILGNESHSPINHGHVRRPSITALQNPHMRYMRLIGNNNPRYQWERYRKSPLELKQMKKKIREYYERTNSLIDRYIYIDGLLDSTLPRDLLQTYNPPETIPETYPVFSSDTNPHQGYDSTPDAPPPLKKRPSYLYKIADEESPLLGDEVGGGGSGSAENMAKVVKFAIYLNLLANTLLLISKILVAIMTNSLSVLASLVDAALDFLSTAIVWTTTTLIERRDKYLYPVGRSRLEPIGVLVFSIIMIVSFLQVGLTSLQHLITPATHAIVRLTPSAITIMLSTIVIKTLCFLWCRSVRNSSVQALAADAVTDVVFNFFSILFPLLGTWLELWWLDALGGALLSAYVIISWAGIGLEHVENLTGAAASGDERNVLLYMAMRFAKSIKAITSVNAYRNGDLLNVEVDIVLDEGLGLKDSHDLGESLQYVIESLGVVDRAFVHLDYDSTNPPGHLR